MRSAQVFLLCVAYAWALPQPASNLQVEYVTNPIVIDVALPRFYWLPVSADRGITQTAYRIEVFGQTQGSIQLQWDSGVITSSASAHIVYGGAPLASDSVYSWSVQWTDSNGAMAPWSPNSTFGTGLFTQAEWAPSAWIGCPVNTGRLPNYNQIRAEFDLQLPQGVEIQQARAYVTAVGYYNFRVNGAWAQQWAGQARPRLDPGWTTYEVRSLYNAYDLTSALVPSGPNAIALMLGNGWPVITPVPGNSSSGVQAVLTPDDLVAVRLNGPAPQLGDDNDGATREMRIQIHIRSTDGNTAIWSSTATGFQRTDARVAAPLDAGWMCGSGALVYDSVYNGCTYNASAYTTGWDAPGYAYGSGAWTSAVLRADPGGAKPTTMSAQGFPAVTVQEELIAQSVSSPSPNVYVFDFGQNIAGFVRMTLPAPLAAGITITLRHAETLQHPPYGPKDGNIYVGNLRGAKATDVYTTAGTDSVDEVFEPVFTYHGFRFVELTGLPYAPTLDTLTALFIRTNVDRAGDITFPYTANVLNQLQHAVVWGIGCNLMSVISDCPQRDERKGWMGDSGLSLQPTHYNYQIGSLYTFWLNNIRDSQMYAGDSHPAGSVPDTVPHTFGAYPSDPAWGTAYPGVVWSTWRMLGDTRVAADHYPNLQLYIAFMTAETNKSGVKKIYQSYGDWCPPPAQLNGGQGPKPPTSYTSGVAFIVDLGRIIDLATALGKTADAATYTTYRDWVVAQFNTAWLQGGVYGNVNGDGLQTANAAAIGIGAASAAGASAFAAIGSALVNDITTTHNSHFSVGIIGMRFLQGSLTRIGSGELAIDTLLPTTYPSYGWAVRPSFVIAMCRVAHCFPLPPPQFTHPDEPATTLWELLDGPTEGPGMNSRNHHMFASVGGWLYEDLAGIGQVRSDSAAYNPADASQSGFRHAVLFPRITTHPAVPFLEAEYPSIAGRYAIAWTNPNSTQGGTCASEVAENGPAVFTCPAGSTFASVAFASFGTPSGTCGSFALGPCNAANSTAILTAACVGQNTCTIDVADSLFGDPCFNTVKWLSAQLVCSTPGFLALTATVPANARATVRLPFPASTAPSSVTVTEGGITIFTNGAFVPGVLGVTGAAFGVNDLPAGILTVDVEVGSGVYALASA
jgi:alpha-L-rhamnosidase